MKTVSLFASTLLALFTGCSAPTAQRANRADGLLDFLAGNPGETDISVERGTDGGGRISTAQVRAFGKAVFVFGRVARRSPVNPPPGSHVDVLVLDGNGKIVESATVTYQPCDIPHGGRGGFPQSHFTVRLTKLPAKESTAKVVFHSIPRSACQWTHKS